MDAMDAWKAQRTAQALNSLVNEQRTAQRLAALEIALAYEVEQHMQAKDELSKLRAQVATLTRYTQRAMASGDALVLTVRGTELFVHHEDGEVTGVFVEPDQDLCQLLGHREVQELEWMVEDAMNEEARHV